jgi:hypothetical protein
MATSNAALRDLALGVLERHARSAGPGVPTPSGRRAPSETANSQLYQLENPPSQVSRPLGHPQWDTPFVRVFAILRERCPDCVNPERWQLAVRDGERLLADWGEQATALGWTARDLFGLHEVPANPHVTYQRLARYDCTGLVWLLQGCPVVAITNATAAIRMPTGSVVTYRMHHKPAYGPLGDSIEDFIA